jgi:5-methyltetrahydrofolate corrinoid/iron sulfur protein methyltransferase
MKIIGEKINGTRKRVAAAIAERDAGFIRELARQQAEQGADWLDLNAGTHPDREAEDLAWLVELVQDETGVPLCLDSANPRALAAAMGKVKKTPMINSISGEPDRLNDILPIATQHDCQVIALAMDGKKIPGSVEARMAVVHRMFEATREAGLPDDRVYVDPLVMTIATNTESGNVTLDTIRAVRAAFPQAHVCLGLSNVSFGLPARSLVNRTLLVLAVAAGMDTAIVDPGDRNLRAALLATELVLGRDRHCLNYTRAYRKGLLDHAPQPA